MKAFHTVYQSDAGKGDVQGIMLLENAIPKGLGWDFDHRLRWRTSGYKLRAQLGRDSPFSIPPLTVICIPTANCAAVMTPRHVAIIRFFPETAYILFRSASVSMRPYYARKNGPQGYDYLSK